MAEHLFYPDSPPQPLPIEYNGPLYDGGDWDQYPIRQGWKDQMGRMSLRAEYYDKIECWLYFGTLFYVFGDKLNQEEFLLSKTETDESEQMKQYLTTTHLHDYFVDADEWKKENYGERAFTIVDKVCQELSTYRKAGVLRTEIMTAIRLICHALWVVSVKRDGPRAKPRHVKNWLVSESYERDYLVEKGWCPWEATKFRFTGAEVDTMAYMLQVIRKKPAWNTKTHHACKPTECVAHNIDESDYVTRHVTEDCGCDHVQADVEKLHTILKDGGIPLVRLIPPADGDEDADAGFKIEITRKRTGKHYVAISHVWSDGLGNTDGNSLPGCQLRLLYEQARRLVIDKEYIPRDYGDPFEHIDFAASKLAHFALGHGRGKDKSVLIWVDTLCIPHQRDVRSLAIQRMRQVYVDAYRTLILDSEMRQLESKSASKTQLLLQVLVCSGWIRRLWTLQEGVAARSRLYTLFADKPVNISTITEELLTRHQRGEIPTMQEGIVIYAMGVWLSFFKETNDYSSKLLRTIDIVGRPFLGPTLEKRHLISMGWLNVATRATSKAGDRPIVLAGVLNLDVKPILDAKGGPYERMRVFYGLLDEFPSGILFENEPRFEDDGMRWAVKTCQFSGDPHTLGHGTGKVTPRGLQASLASTQLFPSSAALRVSRESSDADATEAWAEAYSMNSDDKPDVCVFNLADSVELMPDKQYALIVQDADRNSSRCALLEYQSTEGADVHYVRHVGVGTVRRAELWSCLFWDGYLLPFGFQSLEERTWVVG